MSWHSDDFDKCVPIGEKTFSGTEPPRTQYHPYKDGDIHVYKEQENGEIKHVVTINGRTLEAIRKLSKGDFGEYFSMPSEEYCDAVLVRLAPQ